MSNPNRVTKALKAFLHVTIIILLTLLTQIGGVIWLLVFGYFRCIAKQKPIIFRFATFVLAYLLVSVFVIPLLSPLSGRVPLPITKSGLLIPHNYLYPLLNRHYVSSKLKDELLQVASSISKNNPYLKVSYLDANFPFIDGFPLLPHLSHNDGRKVDLTFYYTLDGVEGNIKPSNSGYGYFEGPTPKEFDQVSTCKGKGYWQYDYAQYLTMGSRDDLSFDQYNTKELILKLLSTPTAQKLFIEPHLKSRMQLSHPKVRYHGCQAVRHDDHIHFQIID